MTRVSNRFANEGWTEEVPTGTVNGSNAVFTLAFTPDDPSAVSVYLNSLLETEYSITGATITFTTAPALGQSVYVTYTKKL